MFHCDKHARYGQFTLHNFPEVSRYSLDVDSIVMVELTAASRKHVVALSRVFARLCTAVLPRRCWILSTRTSWRKKALAQAWMSQRDFESESQRPTDELRGPRASARCHWHSVHCPSACMGECWQISAAHQWSVKHKVFLALRAGKAAIVTPAHVLFV